MMTNITDMTMMIDLRCFCIILVLNVSILRNSVETWALLDTLPWIDHSIVVLVRRDVTMSHNLGIRVALAQLLQELAKSSLLLICSVVDSLACAGYSTHVCNVDGIEIVPLDSVGRQVFCHELRSLAICGYDPVVAWIMPSFVSKFLEQGIDRP